MTWHEVIVDSFSDIPLDGTNSKTLQASFNNFRASVLAQDKEDKSKKVFGTEGRKANKNVSDGKSSDKKETSGTVKSKATTGNISNVVDNLSAEIGSIKLEERSSETVSSNNTGFDLFKSAYLNRVLELRDLY